MSTGLEFTPEISKIVEAGYMLPDVVLRRAAVLRKLAPRTGEKAVDIGCGPGFLTADLAAAVGPSGHVSGFDISDSMLALAEPRTAAFAHVELTNAPAEALPADDENFDVAVSTQVFEYVADIEGALGELHRVLRPGGRAVIVATDWDSIVWNSHDRKRMSRVLAAFEEHCAHVDLPRKLSKLSTEAGFEILERDVYVMLNPDFEPNTFSAGLIMGVATFVPGRRGVTQEEATAWATEQLEIGKAGEYFFSLNQYIFTIRKPV